MARARGSVSIGTPNAFATPSAIMSLVVGPMPPAVKTYLWRFRSIRCVDDRADAKPDRAPWPRCLSL
jgi:hypothetical protein